MKNIDNNLNKYFESARNFKSPISVEKARILIEIVESNIVLQKSFPTFIGKITMASISILLITFFVITNPFISDDKQESNSKNEIKSSQMNIRKIETKNSLEKSTNNKIEKASIANNLSTNDHYQEVALSKTDKKPTTKIQGLNTIQLTEAELIEFGIKYYTKNDGNEIYPGIGFWSPLGDKAAMNQVYYLSKYSEHKQQELPLDSGVKYIKIYPNYITNYKGKYFLETFVSANHQIDINEFEPFSNSLNSFLKLELNEGSMPAEIPQDIDNQLSELQNLFSKVKNKPVNYIEIANKIDAKFKQLDKYFSSFSNNTNIISEQNKALQLTPEDSNLSSVMAVYLNKEPDSSDFAWRDSMAKMGVKLVFGKLPLTMRKYLESNYQELAKILIDYKEKYENYILVNKFVAMEVPFKNDKNNEGLFFWFYPSQTLISALPERFRESLSKEFQLLENEEAICGNKIDAEKLYLDVWRACSGAIENLRIFPNPIQNEMHVKFELKEDREIQYELYDIHGNKIENLFVPRSYKSGSQTALFDFAYLKSGMYLFAVRSNKGEFAVQRFIKD